MKNKKTLLECREPVTLPVGYKVGVFLSGLVSAVEVFTRTYLKGLRYGG